jgi:hypothetical protein
MGRRFGSRSTSEEADAALAIAGSGRMTRKQVADRLGVAETSVRRLEGTYLRPIRQGRFVFFDEAEVERYAAESGGHRRHDSGEVAARAFELFREGKDFRDVVIELRQSPERIRQLLREYALAGDLLISAEIRCEIEQMGYFREGYRFTGRDILDVMRFLADRNKALIQERIAQDNAMDRLRRALLRAERAVAPAATGAPSPAIDQRPERDGQVKVARSEGVEGTSNTTSPTDGPGTHGP